MLKIYFKFFIISLILHLINPRSFAIANNDIKEEISFLSKKKGRINILSYSDSLFNFSFNPIFGYSIENIFKHDQKTFTWGISLEGSHFSGLRFGFKFHDNLVKNYDYTNKIDFLNKRGRVLTRNWEGRSEFSESEGRLTFEKDWILVGIIKENIKIGEGKNSKLILSDRAPTFPAFILDIKFTDWLRAFSLHGWLNSGITDSAKSYFVNNSYRKIEHEKYFAVHFFEFSLINDFNLRIGETIIYSDRGPFIAYFIPFILFRSIDHNFSYGGGDSGNNGSLFFEGNLNIKKAKFYTSFFIDEISLTRFLKGQRDLPQWAYLVGVELKELLKNKMTVSAEYTKILPWVYSNWIAAQTYTNLNFPMGHYIGQNSDQIYVDLSYKFIPELEITLSSDYTRNGGFGDIRNQYTLPGEKFLYGPVRRIFRIGSEVKFKYLENIFINFEYDFYNVSDEDPVRTPDWQRGKNHFVSLRMFYGLDR